MTAKAEKKFDCVKSVRKERDRIAEETKGMSPKQIMAYFQKRKEKRQTRKT